MPRAEHQISREDISDNALKVLYRLHNAGFQAYLVGGCVRDLMLGLHPKDFDVATDATPEQVKGLFRNCRLIGRRFRLAHIIFGREIIEVATFRGHHVPEETEAPVGKKVTSHQNQHGQLIRDNVFGSIEEDAERRDFSFNAMYYNIADFTVTDFANGVESLKKREIVLIGDPETRYREDPVRMLRAIRFAAKLNMNIDSKTAELIPQLAPLLANIPPARLFEEVSKLMLLGSGLKTFVLLQEYKLFGQLFPQLQPFLDNQKGREYQLLEKVLSNTDNRINSGLRITPAFFYAASLWYCVEDRMQQHMGEGGLPAHDAFNLAITDVLSRQVQRIMIPKRFTTPIRDIWYLQQRLSKRLGRRAYITMEHPRFRAAYDFLLIRSEIEGGELTELAQWWTEFQEAAPGKQKKMQSSLRNNEGGNRRRSRPNKPRKPS
ncbi:polynucleotide adenylyltransferase PcnB [Paraneptunicella aestuarii]|uniref:polynucleotide adenylyltransferase PcnB n=1 Tax=Paraneptunicella aestuarii TaxID=2831148 RepID=UPI001E61E37B|nr:polynucleotide adenylyltransferase PcnB [Paraneptunicella aestuarii]UAA40870.1 polynucleotide adenylyltransferase PcnB [Paraneptunicella aestuarii]